MRIVQEELENLNTKLGAKDKPAASAEKKQQFVLERTIEAKKKEIATVEATKSQNAYLLKELLPRYTFQKSEPT